MARVTARNPRSVPSRITNRVNPVEFLQETVSELRKSVWPSREETARLTVVVIVLSIVASIFLGGLDQIFERTFSNFVL